MTNFPQIGQWIFEPSVQQKLINVTGNTYSSCRFVNSTDCLTSYELRIDTSLFPKLFIPA